MIDRREFLKMAGLGGAAFAVGGGPARAEAAGQALETKLPAYIAKDYGRLLGTPGFSETLLKNHFSLYAGYVTNLNKVLDGLAQMTKDDKLSSPEAAELRRRLGWEFDGMRLHELYFENLGGKSPRDPAGKLAQALASGFGGAEAWEKDLRAAGAMRGIGWVVLYQDPAGGRLVNSWVNEHDTGHLAGCLPLLVLDVFEHAYMLDYGLKKADYIAAFLRAVDWTAVEARLR
jgi:Fe-Mn family superoxide dismutase